MSNLSSVKRTKSTLLWSIIAVLFFSFSERGFAAEMGGAEVLDIQQQRVISGRIVDQTGEPIIGASIIEMGSNPLNGTITNLDGEYTLHLTTAAPTLHISFIGFEDMVINVGNQSIFNLVMREYVSFLDEIVVIGYGTARRRDLTGAIATIRAENLQAEAPRSIQDMLRANAPGLSIGFGTAAAGTSSILVRGNNTLGANAEPLIVLDGVIWQGGLSDINPMDIASIDILKDASSAAVFGARAAGGVVVLTTTRGARTERPTISVNTSVGMVHSASPPRLKDGAQFMNMRTWLRKGMEPETALNNPQIFNDPRRLQGVSQLDWLNYDSPTPFTSFTEEDLLRRWASRLGLSAVETDNFILGRETNWFDEVFQTGFQQDYHISVAHRTDASSYFWSMGWSDREGIVYGNRFQVFRTRLNLEANITPFLRVGIHSGFSARNQGFLTRDWGAAPALTPFAVNEIGNEDAPRALWRDPVGGGTTSNPLHDHMYRHRRDWFFTLDANIFAVLSLPFNIEYQVNFTPYYQWRDFMNHDSTDNFIWEAQGGLASRRTYTTFAWMVDNVLRWNQRFNDIHNVQVTLLANAERRQHWSMNMQGIGFSPSDVLGWHNMGASDPSRRIIGSNDYIGTGDALMARVFYSLLDRYMLTLSLRRDGFSAFGQNNPRGIFPSVAGAWTFTSEEFAQSIDWLDFGRLRLSWGQNGNRDIPTPTGEPAGRGLYEALADLEAHQHPYITHGGNIGWAMSMQAARMANAGLRWERTAASNIGLDFGLFAGRLGGTIDAYLSTTTDLLVRRALPTITGFENVMANLGRLENRGFEISLRYDVISNQNFNWNSSFGFALNRRTLRALYGDMVDVFDDRGNVIGQREVDDPSNGWFIGQDPNRIWQFERAGVWQEHEREEAARWGLAPGDIRWVSQTGRYELTDDDRIFQGYTTPRFRWSWRNEFTLYRNWTVSTMIYSLWGHYGRTNFVANTGNLDRQNMFDQPFWTPENPTNKWGRLSGRNLGNIYLNRSFIRLDNVTVSYSVPRNLLQRAHIQGMRISASVRNPLVWAPHWERWDPETGSPTPRTYSLSLNFTL